MSGEGMARGWRAHADVPTSLVAIVPGKILLLSQGSRDGVGTPLAGQAIGTPQISQQIFRMFA